MHPTLLLPRSTTTTTLNLLRTSTTNPTRLAFPVLHANQVYLRQARQPYSNGDGSSHDKNPQSRDLPASPKSRELEHPGPPPPNTSEISQNTGATLSSEQQVDPDLVRRQEHERREQQRRQQQEPVSERSATSTGAKPTLTDGSQSPNVDGQGRIKDDLPEDVRRHNKELEERHDRAYNRIVDEGNVSRGFWKGDEGSLTDSHGKG